MSVLDRTALEASPLADLHAIASQLGMDGFRRLRKADLIDRIVERQGGEGPAEAGGGADADADATVSDTTDAPGDDVADAPGDDVADAPGDDAGDGERPTRARPRRRRGGRGRGRGDGAEGGGDRERGGDRDRGGDRERGGDRDRVRGRDREDRAPRDDDAGEERTAEGTVEILPNGSGFVRVSPPDPSDEDVYVSAAQIRRCELVSGDTVSGPVRRPRRSERFASLVRVDTINGSPADEVAEGTRYDDLPAAFPAERFSLHSEDVTLKAIEWLTPFGRGSRVSMVGPARAGKSEALRRLAGALAAQSGLEVSVVLAGARPEEVSEWSFGPVTPAATAPLGASAETQAQAVENAVDHGRRIAARGGNAVVLVDTLDGLHANAARRALAAARNISDGGSLTVIATVSEPLGGETTVIAFDAGLAGARRFPAIDVTKSGTLRPELLVGEAGAEAIARARVEVYGSA